MHTRSLLPLALTAVLAPSLTAQITYVDADANTNTTLADGSPFVPATTAIGNDNNWSDRAFANNGTIYTSNDGPSPVSEDAPMLRTTLTGLAPGLEYLVYAYFWNSNASTVWRGRALVSSTQPAPEIQGYNTRHFATSSFMPSTALAFDAQVGPQTHLLLNYDGSGFETDGHFVGQVMIQQDNRWLFEIPLGTHVADVQGEITVYFDDLANTSTSNRTWYDGLGYELAPTTFGTGCGTPSIPTIGYTGSPLMNADFSVDLQSGSVSAPCVLAVGFDNTTFNGQPLPISLGTYGFPRCDLNVALDWTGFIMTGASGEASTTFNFPSLPPATLYWQWFVLGAGVEVTSGLETRFHR